MEVAPRPSLATLETTGWLYRLRLNPDGSTAVG